MISTSLKPYPAYKDSGVPWLGAIPAHWEVHHLGSLVSPVSQRGKPNLPLLSVVREKGVVLRTTLRREENHNFVPDDLSNYKVVCAGNLVINKMKAWQGSLGIASIDGIVSPAYYVFDFKVENKQFNQILLRSNVYVGFFAQASDGVRIGQWDLSLNGMKRIPVIVPPADEQEDIVHFVERLDHRVNRFVRAKRRLIGLLDEQKRAIIHRAVTRGLDPDVPLKPSGVEWLGEVPAHWEVVRSRRLFATRRELARQDDVQLSATQAYGVIPQAEFEKLVGRRVVKIFMHLEKRRHVEKDDFVVSMRSFQGGLERAWIYGAIRSSYVVIMSQSDISVDYFEHLFKVSSQ